MPGSREPSEQRLGMKYSGAEHLKNVIYQLCFKLSKQYSLAQTYQLTMLKFVVYARLLAK